MPTLTDLIKQGEKERERGNLKESIRLFYEALRIADETQNDGDRSMICAHLGLTYIKEGDWFMAERQFDLALEYAKRARNTDRIIEAQRHFSMIFLHKGDYAEALKQASQALESAKKLGRTDLPWFTHACVKVVLKMNTTKSQKWEWIKVEINHLNSVWWKEKNKVAKMQWLKGLMKAIFQVTFS